MNYIKKFADITQQDIGLVGGKNASLGQMIRDIAHKIRIPDGFAVTAQGYWYFLEYNKSVEKLRQIMTQLTNVQDISLLQRVGKQARDLILAGTLPQDLADEIIEAYHVLSEHYKGQDVDVAVRSSATAEDLPGASFAGQQETFLNVRGTQELLEAVKKCFASLFTDRAIVYRIEKGFDYMSIGLSVGVQKMVRSDKAVSGVMFTLDTESGFKEVVMIDASYGLGESIVQGRVKPDEFMVHKPTLRDGFSSIIKKDLGTKETKLVYADGSQTKELPVSKDDQNHFSLTDEEILALARAGLVIEDYYSGLQGSWVPMDIEWAKDGVDNELYIVQARPETVHSREKLTTFMRYHIVTDQQDLAAITIVTGQSIGQQIATGTVRIVASMRELSEFDDGDILVTGMTDPDWVPIMKRAAAIITDRGGRTCHAAILSRELGIPAIVGTFDATKKLKNGQVVTVDCAQGASGYVYDGSIEYTQEKINVAELPRLQTKIMLNLADPDRAFSLSYLPVDGVGLARTEFIMSNMIRIHPVAAVKLDVVKDKKVVNQIEFFARAYESVADYVVDTLAQGVATLAAAFYPRPVIVRFSDFKSNEYANLLGGSFFEPVEANPMLGLRGASRYYSELYRQAFALECKALNKARHDMGLRNIQIMVPFVRTTKEARVVLDLMKAHGLEAGKDDLKIIMMCEVPSNVILIDKFSQLFDGFSIGSNDLTQMTLGVDRDSALLAALFNEQDEAVMAFIAQAIQGAQKCGKTIGICGQAPSDYPQVADYLIKQGINSISLNPDSVLPFLFRHKK